MGARAFLLRCTGFVLLALLVGYCAGTVLWSVADRDTLEDPKIQAAQIENLTKIQSELQDQLKWIRGELDKRGG